MSQLLESQWLFFRQLCRWGVAISERGYKATWGDAYRDRRIVYPYSVAKNSKHYDRLAVDVNLFDRNGKWLKVACREWDEVGALWESMGGTWGGRWKKKDLNHLSWGEV